MSDISPSYEEIVAVIYTARCGDIVHTWEMPLIVNHRAGLVADEAEVVTLTSDGRHYQSGAWHDGPTSESVYVERWRRDFGRVFQGWIDSVSRRLVQSG